jgi:hypothetical protein
MWHEQVSTDDRLDSKRLQRREKEARARAKLE